MPNPPARDARLTRLARWMLALGTIAALFHLAGLESPSTPPRHIVLLSLGPEAARTLAAAEAGADRTPELASFLSEVSFFRRAIAQADTKGPALRSLFTGRYPTTTLTPHGPLPAPDLATELKAAGFRTAAFVSPDVPSEHAEPGGGIRADFDLWQDDAPDLATRAAAARRWLAETGDERSFLFFEAGDAQAAASLSAGMDALRATELLDSSLLVVFAPTAAQTGEPERRLAAQTVHVPLAFRMPHHERRRFDAMVEMIDVAPTIHGLAGLPRPQGLRGRDLSARIRHGGALEADRIAYAQHGFGDGAHTGLHGDLQLLVDRATGEARLFHLGEGFESAPAPLNAYPFRRGYLRRNMKQRLEESVADRRTLHAPGSPPEDAPAPADAAVAGGGEGG